MAAVDVLELASDMHEEMIRMGENAKEASIALAEASSDTKNMALREAAASIRAHIADIMKANETDMTKAKAGGLEGPMLDRLALNIGRIKAIAAGLESIADLPDPVGRELAAWDRPNGLSIKRVSVPLGVIGIIYESRPNVTADAGALCLKSGNAVILRGGSESFHSSKAIAACLQEGLKKAGLPAAAIQLVETTDRAAVGEMLRMTRLIDVIIPRGGKSLVERVMKDSRIPTLLHLDGNNHTYIHSAADVDKAVKIVVNAKMRRTSVCGATESLVIDEAVVDTILPKLVAALVEQGCEIRGDARAQKVDNRILTVTAEDWDTEYLDAILSVRTVATMDQAIEHINVYSSRHTDAIITEDKAAADYFIRKIDSAIVMHNTSTQFADGGEFGMGAEIGIATGRLHARGPVGCEQLTTYKYVVSSDGAVRPA